MGTALWQKAFDWNEANTAVVVNLWTEGTTASEIGGRLGISRSAVLGKMNRLGLMRAPAPKAPRKARERPSRLTFWNSGPSKSPASLPDDEIPATAVTLRDLEPGQCKWPYGDGPFFFCAAPAVEGRPYCPGHMMKAHNA